MDKKIDLSRVKRLSDTPTVFVPAVGWTGPDSRGHMQYTIHGVEPASFKRPELDGFECYLVAVRGLCYTRWMYRPGDWEPVDEQRDD